MDQIVWAYDQVIKLRLNGIYDLQSLNVNGLVNSVCAASHDI